MPGVSRSGITITVARFLGLDRDSAARFSFLLLIPIVFGASLWKESTTCSSATSGGLDGAVRGRHDRLGGERPARDLGSARLRQAAASTRSSSSTALAAFILLLIAANVREPTF